MNPAYAVATAIIVGMSIVIGVLWHKIRVARHRNLDLVILAERWAKNSSGWQEEYARLIGKFDHLNNNISKAAEAEAKRIIAGWEPDPELVDSDFKKAEFMANNRELKASGRKTMPREDQEGEPAIVRKVVPRHRANKNLQ